MKMLGDDVYIQRGEIWSLDFSLEDTKGRPIMLPKAWNNPYLVITVTAALYKQKGDYRQSYWIDLSSLPRFVATEPLFLPGVVNNENIQDGFFTIQDVMSTYGDDGDNDDDGKFITNDGDTTKESDVTNYLFCADVNDDGNYSYKYVVSYELEGEEKHEDWQKYDFRIVKQFTTRDWTEQRYLYDAKIVSGQTVEEYIKYVLTQEKYDIDVSKSWTDEDIRNAIEAIADKDKKEYVQKVYNSGAPLMPEYETYVSILSPRNIYVSVDLQGGIE